MRKLIVITCLNALGTHGPILCNLEMTHTRPVDIARRYACHQIRAPWGPGGVLMGVRWQGEEQEAPAADAVEEVVEDGLLQ